MSSDTVHPPYNESAAFTREGIPARASRLNNDMQLLPALTQQCSCIQPSKMLLTMQPLPGLNNAAAALSLRLQSLLQFRQTNVKDTAGKSAAAFLNLNLKSCTTTGPRTPIVFFTEPLPTVALNHNTIINSTSDQNL